ncbi:ClpP/crotonase-like domain-containing protein [Irpex rosettiformis]|uniref:ClpP/crotonase-like domain-containing protein n=1 Tax=Irpex rosettiformis TaxID=378272 RepID=A0ACB8UGL3_9APHY|nr:ClpP/crotonase-like domain-containing protein [Irpex rosettiformis]
MTDFSLPIPPTSTIALSFPEKHVLLLTFNRPKALNVLTQTMEEEIGRAMDWFEKEPSLGVVIVTGAGPAFCAGGDIKAVLRQINVGAELVGSLFYGTTANGFGALSRRSKTTKPIIAAVNGLAFGGGMEIVLNCDIVIASEKATFGAVETSKGLVGIHGGIPRLSRIAGHQLASEAYLMSRIISAQEAYERFHFVNRVVPLPNLLNEVLETARVIIERLPRRSKL